MRCINEANGPDSFSLQEAQPNAKDTEKMKSCVALVLVATCAGMTYGWGQRYRNVTVSQANFVSIAVALVTKRYDALMKEQKALEPETKVCSDKVTARNNTCMNCMSGITQCGDLSPLEMALLTMKNPKMLGPLSRKLLGELGKTIAGGVDALYSKYGAGPLKTLQNGFNNIAKGWNWFDDKLKTVLRPVFNGMIKGFASLGNIGSWAKTGWNSFTSIFGRRRRSDDSYEIDDDDVEEFQEFLYPSVESRAKRADDELTPAQKQCVKSNCPVCTPFIDATNAGADPVDAWRTICGASIIDRNLAINKKAEGMRKFYALFTGAVVDILQAVEVDTSNGLVTKVVAYTGKLYKEYNPKNIIFDLWNQDPAYQKIAAYLLDTHTT